MKKIFLFPLCLCLMAFIPMQAKAYDGYETFADRLRHFNSDYPQEKVFLHLDNTCYFLGDTIWFKAYTRQTDTGKPSGMSGVLYVELLNHDGYLMERKLIEMVDGEGDGFFSLLADSSMYSGFYELRAYTRWQLNWGEFEHQKTLASRKWFFNKTMEYEFFRDYEKLYSRVFPVYDKPDVPGDYALSMSERPKLRYYSMNPSASEMSLSFFPEGGTLVEGVPCRVAFEAIMTDGEYLEGGLVVDGKTVPVVDRGRGVFTVTPRPEKAMVLTFRTKDGREISRSLPKAQTVGASMSVEENGDDWQVKVHTSDNFPADSLAFTLMHEGRLVRFAAFQSVKNVTFDLKKADLEAGVHQVTLYDRSGRVWADRLFFVKKDGLQHSTLTFTGTKESYKSYEQIRLDVQSRKGNTHISVAVRDATGGSRNDDTGNILTEMLLASEIRGFVPQPEWYFEADDERHNRALDLLMMTQGWRRFDWSEMAVKGQLVPVHPMEKTPYIFGAVHAYEATEKYSPQNASVLREHYKFMGMGKEMIDDDIRRKFGFRDKDGSRYSVGKDLASGNWKKHADTLGMTKDEYRRWKGDGERMKHEVVVHGEADYKGSILEMDARADDGQFRFKTPRLYGEYWMHLQASDYSKWTQEEKENYSSYWDRMPESAYPEFYVRISYPYPKFVKPYTHYQTTHRPLELKDSHAAQRPSLEKTLQEVKVYASHGGLRRDKYMRPILSMDAYDAFNRVVDAGLMDAYYSSSAILSRALAQYHVGHMGMEGNYNVVNRLDNIYGNVSTTFRIGGMSVEEATKRFNRLSNLDSVFIFTDYSPRLEGDKRYYGSDQPAVSILFKPGRTEAYRDRYMKMYGFSYPAEFYSPDYSRQTPPDDMRDYRRTLYWNPNVMLDSEGKARITLYNNARAGKITVDAAGQAADGTLLWGGE